MQKIQCHHHAVDMYQCHNYRWITCQSRMITVTLRHSRVPHHHRQGNLESLVTERVASLAVVVRVAKAVQGADMVGGVLQFATNMAATVLHRLLLESLVRVLVKVARAQKDGVVQVAAVATVDGDILVRVPAVKVARALPANLARAVLGVLRHPAVALIPLLHEVGVVVAIAVAKVGKQGGTCVLLSRNSLI